MECKVCFLHDGQKVRISFGNFNSLHSRGAAVFSGFLTLGLLSGSSSSQPGRSIQPPERANLSRGPSPRVLRKVGGGPDGFVKCISGMASKLITSLFKYGSSKFAIQDNP